MTSKTHNAMAVAGLLSAAVWLEPTGLGPATVAAALVANVVGSLLPDLDQAQNRLWDLLPGGNTAGKVLRNLFLAHRSITHSLVGIGMVWITTDWLTGQLFNREFVNPGIILWSVMIGYLTHLAGDGLTEEGLPLLWPLKWKLGFPPIKGWRIKSGRWFEKWIIFPATFIYITGLGIIYWETIRKVLTK